MINKNILLIFSALFVVILLQGCTFSKNSIQNILEFPENNMAQQLEISGQISVQNGIYYAKDNNGYKIEISECTSNRDLEIGKNTLIKGYILSNSSPVFICGIYNEQEYKARLDEIARKERLQKAAIDAQERQALQKVYVENRRKEVEQDYLVKISKITTGMSQTDVENILGMTASKCEYKSLAAANQCYYEKVIDDTYKFYDIIIYKNGFEYQTEFSVSTI